MSFVGKYVNETLNAILEVTTADVSNGQAEGSLTIGGVKVPVQIRYHYKGNTGAETTLRINGGVGSPDRYVGGAGYTNNSSFKSINLAGGYATGTTVTGFSGEFVKK